MPVMLTFGNLRAILHNGVSEFLEYLAQNDDPLKPNKLLADLDAGKIAIDEAVFYLELIFRATVEKYDRFLEYNTTTTQSDYGEQFFSLLDFLRLERSTNATRGTAARWLRPMKCWTEKCHE